MKSWHKAGFAVSTFLFMLPWQFAQFALFMQVRGSVVWCGVVSFSVVMWGVVV